MLIAVLVVLAFLVGGSAREDVVALAILRPVAIALCAYGAWRFSPLNPRQGTLLWLSGAMLLLPLLHLIPLPPELWVQLPGRGLIADIDRSTGAGPLWRPLSVSPIGTMNALLSLAVPLAIVVLGLRLPSVTQRRLIPVVLVCAAATILLGLLQTISPKSLALFPYTLTTVGLPVGLFANRNHQALFLVMLIPILAVYAARHDAEKRVPIYRTILALAGGLFAIVLLTLTGSRAGLLALVPALLSVPLLYRAGYRQRAWIPKPRIAALVGAATVAVLFGAIIISGRNMALQRLITLRFNDESRLGYVAPVWQAAREYFPFGSGIGTFDRAFRITEPASMLSGEYLNHAHNEFLELAMTGGIPAILLAAVVMIAVVSLGVGHFRDQHGSDATRYGRLGTVVIALVALGSGVDYPLRVPAIMAVMAIAALWITGGKSRGETAK